MIFRKFLEPKDGSRNIKIIMILGSDKEIHNYLENHFARLRIAKGTLFNIPFLTIAEIAFVSTNAVTAKISICGLNAIILLFGAILFALAYVSWKRRNTVYREYIQQASERMDLLKKEKRG